MPSSKTRWPHWRTPEHASGTPLSWTVATTGTSSSSHPWASPPCTGCRRRRPARAWPTGACSGASCPTRCSPAAGCCRTSFSDGRMSPPTCATSSWPSMPRPTNSARKARWTSSRSAGAWATGSDWRRGAARAQPRESGSRPWSGPSTSSTARSPSCTPTPWPRWPPPTRQRSAPRWPRSPHSSGSGWSNDGRVGVWATARTRSSIGWSTPGPMRNPRTRSRGSASTSP